MSYYPRRDRAGNLVPWLADYLRGRQEIEGQGLAHPPDAFAVAELGRALADQAPPTDLDQDQDLAHAVAQVQERNRIERERDQAQTAPEPSLTKPPNIPSRSSRTDEGPGGGRHGEPSPAKGSDRLRKTDPIKYYLQNVPDPDDEDWTPS